MLYRYRIFYLTFCLQHRCYKLEFRQKMQGKLAQSRDSMDIRLLEACSQNCHKRHLNSPCFSVLSSDFGNNLVPTGRISMLHASKKPQEK
jgi:hypothetical protein